MKKEGVMDRFWNQLPGWGKNGRNNQDLDTNRIFANEANNLNENGENLGLNNVPMMLNMLQGSNATTCDEGNRSQLTEILSDPLKALETNEKLRNAVAAKGKQMGWNLIPTNNITSNQIVAHNSDSKVPSTDLGLIELNEKIKIHQSGDTTDTINILMFGKSGCGQTTLLSYLTENNQLIGTDSMSTQQFSAETFQLPSDSGMTKICINESPGMCSGFEIQELQEHWNLLISRVNKEGGVSVFLLLIKSYESITSQFIDEIEEFSELYFDEREELWKRTVVVFTSIDELKGCNSLEDRVKKLETQIVKPGMEKVKAVLDQTSTRCIYVSSIDLLDKQRVVNILKDRLQSIEPRELQIRESNSVSNEICENLPERQIEERYVTTDRVGQSSPIVHQPSPKHPPEHIPHNSRDQATEPALQYAETDNGINPQNSENPDKQSSYSTYLKSGRNNNKASHDSINNNPNYYSNSINFTEQILPNDDTTSILTRASSQASSLSIPPFQSQLREQIQDTYGEYSNTEAVLNPAYSKVGFLPTSYSINEVLRSICKTDDKKIQSVKNLANNFEKFTQLGRLTKQFSEKNDGSKQSNSPPCIQIRSNANTTSDKPSYDSVYPDKAIFLTSQKHDSKSKTRNTSHYPNNTTSSSHVDVHVSQKEIEKKEPNIQNKATQTQYSVNFSLIDTQNAATPPSMNSIQCKQLNSEWLKQLENNDSTVLKQLTHDNLLELIFKTYQNNQGKECIINAYKQLSSD